MDDLQPVCRARKLPVVEFSKLLFCVPFSFSEYNISYVGNDIEGGVFLLLRSKICSVCLARHLGSSSR